MTDDAAVFCRTLYPRLLGALQLATGDHALAEDLAQETLCRVCERWSEVRRMDSPEGWAFTVAFNLSRSWWRRAAVARRARAGLVAERAVDARRNQDAYAQIDTREVVRAAVAALPARQRQVVALRYFADLPVDQTAAAMGCAPGTVKSLASKARRQLMAELEAPRLPAGEEAW